MNTQQALAKARKLIGKGALIRYDACALTQGQKTKLPYWKYLADKNEQRRIRGMLHQYRCTIGKIEPITGMFFEVMGTGDNWAEAIENLKKYIERHN